jgi:hypothetical protein
MNLKDSTDTLNWLLGDHLGSTSMMANASGFAGFLPPSKRGGDSVLKLQPNAIECAAFSGMGVKNEAFTLTKDIINPLETVKVL